MKRMLSSPLIAALIGGLIVAVVMVAAGAERTDHTTTVRVEVPAGLVPTAQSGGGLTPRQIYARDAAGVVYVTAKVIQTSSPFDVAPSSAQGTATGSGLVIDRSGRILTNAHVIAGAVRIRVEFAGGQTVSARVIGKDPDDDLALLKVDPAGLHLVPLKLGNSSSVVVGDPTLAIGNPFGLSRTLTTGVVSALQREIQAPNGFFVSNVIQTDAPINPGNSGGPLINAQGEVIGINSQIQTAGDGSTGSVGIGFAIPINTAKLVIPQLERTGKVTAGYLGVTTVTVSAAFASEHLGAAAGALIEMVGAGSPAASAGLRGGSRTVTLGDGEQPTLGGDIVVAVDGIPINSAAALENAIVADTPGQVVRVGVVRGRRRLTISVRLGTRPNTLPSSG